MNPCYLFKYRYLLYKLYFKFNSNSLYINVNIPKMFSKILSTVEPITAETSSYSGIIPTPVIISSFVLNPSTPDYRYLVLTLMPFVLLQNLLYLRNSETEELLDKLILIVDTNYDSSDLLFQVFDTLLEEAPQSYKRSLLCLFYHFFHLISSYPSYTAFYSELKNKLEGKYDFY